MAGFIEIYIWLKLYTEINISIVKQKYEGEKSGLPNFHYMRWLLKKRIIYNEKINEKLVSQIKVHIKYILH